MSDVESWLTPDQRLRLECARIAGDDGTGRSVGNARAIYDFVVEKLQDETADRIISIVLDAYRAGKIR